MFQRRDQLCLRFESTDELRAIGQLCADLLHRDLAMQRRLRRPPHHGERTFAHHLVELVPEMARAGRRGKRELGVLGENFASSSRMSGLGSRPSSSASSFR